MANALLSTNLNLPNKRSGKVRDLYDVRLEDGRDALLIVATDRISAFDVVMQNGLPGKGIVLTQISRFWFDYFADVLNHLISTDVADVPGLTDGQRRALAGRIMLCRKTEVVPFECVVRGYLAGSGYKEYQKTGAVCGIEDTAKVIALWGEFFALVKAGRIAQTKDAVRILEKQHRRCCGRLSAPRCGPSGGPMP